MARPVGSQNKIGAQARNALWEAYNKLGGMAKLVEFGKENPEAFYKLWAKLIPNDSRIELAVSHRIVRNFSGQPSLEHAETLPVLEGEVSVVQPMPTHMGGVTEAEIDRSYESDDEDDSHG